MAVNSKTHIVHQGYQRGKPPVLEQNIINYLQDELQRIETAIRTIGAGSIEVLDEPPINPLKGSVRYNISPWDPLGDGSEGLVLWNGTAWVDV
ncbi:MAG: hypothetical protein ACPGQQ_03030 [Candidatus Puniceispirillaceae bacterium]